VPQENSNEEDGNDNKVSRYLQKTRPWMVIFMAVATCLQLLIHPILSSAVGLARVAIPFYKGLAPNSVLLAASLSLSSSSSQPPMETTTSPAELLATQCVRDLTEQSVRLRRDLASAREHLFHDLAALENESFQPNQKLHLQIESFKKTQPKATPSNRKFQKECGGCANILNREKTISSAAVAGIRSAVGESMAEYVLDLGSIESLDDGDGVDTNELTDVP
jgi:hypothetical protein